MKGFIDLVRGYDANRADWTLAACRSCNSRESLLATTQSKSHKLSRFGGTANANHHELLTIREIRNWRRIVMASRQLVLPESLASRLVVRPDIGWLALVAAVSREQQRARHEDSSGVGVAQRRQS